MNCLLTAWDRHEAELRGWLRQRLGNPVDADDLLQDLFIKAMRQGERFCTIVNARAWLFEVARNAVVDRLRLTREMVELPQDLTADTEEEDLNSLVKGWVTTLPADVTFKRVPVSFGRAAWANLARLYYTLETTGDLQRLDDAVFQAIHRERVNLFSAKAIVDWVARQGMDVQRFTAAYNSFSVHTMLARGEELTRKFKVEGVPLLTVDGRYAVTAREARSFADHLAITEGLIGLTRAARLRNG